MRALTVAPSPMRGLDDGTGRGLGYEAQPEPHGCLPGPEGARKKTPLTPGLHSVLCMNQLLQHRQGKRPPSLAWVGEG